MRAAAVGTVGVKAAAVAGRVSGSSVGRRAKLGGGIRRNGKTVTVSKPTRSVAAAAVAAPAPEVREGEFDYGAVPPFTLKDIRDSIPKHCWEKDTWRSMAYMCKDVAIVFGLAAAAAALDNALVWPLYWIAQGTMFWALFVVGHDCGHQSFSNNKALNDFVGHLTHSSILVPYHGWRVSHRTHHANHGHVENDESWHPVSEKDYDAQPWYERLARHTFPFTLFVYPAYLWNELSHFDPNHRLYNEGERNQILTSAACYFAMVAGLCALAATFGPMWVVKLYVIPYFINVAWLDVVTYLHHHGYDKPMPWYRGEEWNYMRGGLTTIDRDFGIFNKIHHDIGTHVVHHLFPQIPHYNLCEATEAAKGVMGEYYREPEKSKGPIPFHLVKPLVDSFNKDRFVPNTGDVVYYSSK